MPQNPPIQPPVDYSQLMGMGQQQQQPQNNSLISRFFGSNAGSGADNPLLSGSNLPNTNVWSNLLPNHPRIAEGLGNATMMASMIPGGDTIGQNISQVAGAMSQLPYAKLMRAYQMYQPALETAQTQSKMNLEQAQTGEANAHANLYSYKNQYDLMASQQRMQNEAAMRMEGQKVSYGFGPGGTYGYWQNLPVKDDRGNEVRDQSGGIQFKQTFTQTHTADEARRDQPNKAYGTGSTRFGGLGQLGAEAEWLLKGKGIDPETAGADDVDSALNEVHQRRATAAAQGNLNNPVSNADNVKEQRARVAKNDEDVMGSLKTEMGKLDESDPEKMSQSQQKELDQRLMADHMFDKGDMNAGIQADKDKMVASAKQRRGVYARLQALAGQYAKQPISQQTGLQDFFTQKGYDPVNHKFNDPPVRVEGPDGKQFDAHPEDWPRKADGTPVATYQGYKLVQSK